MEDMIYGITKKYNDTDMIFHHLVSGGVLFYSIMMKTGGSEMVFSLFSAESTAPLYNIALIFQAQNKYPKLITIMNLTFMGLFIILRTTYITWIYKFPTMNNDVLLWVVTTSVWVLGMYWVWAMLQKGTKIIHQVKYEFLFLELGYSRNSQSLQVYEEHKEVCAPLRLCDDPNWNQAYGCAAHLGRSA